MCKNCFEYKIKKEVIATLKVTVQNTSSGYIKVFPFHFKIKHVANILPCLLPRTLIRSGPQLESFTFDH
jgi:hypothetical protein